MHCGEFETRLNDWLDRLPAESVGLRPELDFAASAHARKCSKCGELLAGHEMLLTGLQALPLPEPSPGFAFRVLDEVTAHAKQPATSPWSRSAAAIRWAGPLAAAVLVAVVSLLRSWFAPGTGPATNNMAAAPAAPVVQSASTLRYLALLREKGWRVWSRSESAWQHGGLAGTGIVPPTWIDHVTAGMSPLPTQMGAVLIAQPLTSPMGAALMAINGPIPGA